jgi:hypothetical protein
MFLYQDYPQDKMELIILDDSIVPIKELPVITVTDNITYIYQPNKLTLGKKRNKLNSLAKGDIILWMDDDDFYPQNRVSYAVSILNKYSNSLLKNNVFVTSSKIIIYNIKQNSFQEYGSSRYKMTTNATLGYYKEFLETHKYNDDAFVGEEDAFVKNGHIVNLDSFNTIVVLCHDTNTVSKSRCNPNKLKRYKFNNKNEEDYFKNLVNLLTS